MAYRFPAATGFEIFSGAAVRFNGVNSREYSFGNEVTASLGAKLYTHSSFDYSIYARFRWAAGDERFASKVPNTGGRWVYIIPNLTARVWKGMGLKTEVEFPIYRKLNGFRQFTSNVLFSVSVFYEI